MFIETASGTVTLPDGIPDWVVANLVEQNGGALPAAVTAPPDPAPGAPPPDPADPGPNNTAAPQGDWVIANDGTPLYFAPGLPDWVIRDQLDQHGGLRPPGEPGPVQVTPPGRAGPGPGGNVANVPPPGAPGSPLPPPGTVAPSPGLVPRVIGAVGTVASDVADIAGRVLGAARDLLGPIGDVVGNVVGTLLDGTRKVIDFLVPTISELALGLTNKFADLAGFIGGHLADVGDFAGAMAGGMYEALAGIFDAPFVWLVKGLLWFLRLLGRPLTRLYDELYQLLPEPEL